MVAEEVAVNSEWISASCSKWPGLACRVNSETYMN